MYLMGATVQSWKVGEKECFFTSDVADFSGKKAIRAGIPICFPQFGPYGDLPTHGFARVTNWEVRKAVVTSSFVKSLYLLFRAAHFRRAMPSFLPGSSLSASCNPLLTIDGFVRFLLSGSC